MRVVVVGAGGVGKSSLTIRFLTSSFVDEEYNPTIEDSYTRQLVVDGAAVQLEILDTAGQEEYEPMADQWYQFGRGFLLVYSVTDRAWFEGVAGLLGAITRAKLGAQVPVVLVSNKCDLEHARKVSSAEGQAAARALRAPFVETSALDGVNVDVAFHELIRRVRRAERRGVGRPNGTHPLTTQRPPPKLQYKLKTRRSCDDGPRRQSCFIM
ncbi:hypothetical protein VHUM_01816 [Vanrija humicola]|uniref:Uncharacterized protein n=1 Tax=Vanrija humicola TaxID=5417 RepID=A0A7D8V2W5_VANHU|nr:hypothetical protein VHUM_01816 [Vanrija humicola]